jgi:hypothetical protein
MTIEFIINAIIYFTLCATLPHVCIIAMFATKSKLTRVTAITSLISFFYLGLYCMNFK